MNGKEEVFFLEKGDLKAVPSERGNCQFVFNNPSSEKPDTALYMSALRVLANSLTNAQSAVRSYNVEQAELEKRKKDGLSVIDPNTVLETTHEEEKELYRKTISEFTSNGIHMRADLRASVYNKRGYIFYKRYWFTTETETEMAKWVPCKGGFQFTLNDSVKDMMDFAREQDAKYSKTPKDRQRWTAPHKEDNILKDDINNEWNGETSPRKEKKEKLSLL